MKYFTPEWHGGDADEHPGEEYQEYLAPLLSQWPPDVQALAARVSLHDGFIRKAAWNTQEATLFLRLRCGDLQVGYFDLDLYYSGVLFSPLDWASLLALSTSKNSEALYNEVDEEDRWFVHRILFVSHRRVRRPRRYRASHSVRMSRRGVTSRGKTKLRYREVVIRFSSLRLAVVPRQSRFDAEEWVND